MMSFRHLVFNNREQLNKQNQRNSPLGCQYFQSEKNFDLSPVEFTDGIALRYNKPSLGIPDLHDGCGSIFDFSCSLLQELKGSLVTRHQNEIRDVIANMSSLVWNQVRIEPIVKEADSSPALISDIGICSV